MNRGRTYWTSAAWGLLVVGSSVSCQDDRALSIGASPQAIAAKLFSQDTCYNAPEHGGMIRDAIRAINAERTRRKLPPLKPNETLGQIADFYACRLSEGDFFSHIDPYDGSFVNNRADNFGYAHRVVGENLAAGQTSVDQVMADWINSPEHLAVILDPRFTEIGVAVKIGGPIGPYWVTEFGRPVATAGEDVESPSSQPGARPLEVPASAPGG